MYIHVIANWQLLSDNDNHFERWSMYCHALLSVSCNIYINLYMDVVYTFMKNLRSSRIFAVLTRLCPLVGELMEALI